MQGGFGLLEALAGLLVFVILAGVGTKAFKNVVANHRESREMKALTDAVATTAEKLSTLTVATLTAAGPGYTQWSAPAAVGMGEFLYRYRIVPGPMVAGAVDTSVVGLEVQAGVLTNNVFIAGRVFATLIAPHLSSKNAAGKVTTLAERQAEAAFYASLKQQLSDLNKSVVTENQTRLNSYSCYDQGQCCGFMKQFFANQNLNPTDGLNEKCYYRCALSGNVSVKTWNSACGTDFCRIAPWQTKADCCAAITTGECQPGSVCANVCIDCVGENGSTCGPPICDGGWWNDFFDCKNMSFCDGTPLPDGIIPNWGNVRALCGTSTCAAIPSECTAWKAQTCCKEYWGHLALGQPIDPKAEICAQISTQAECCDLQTDVGNWNLYCSNTGVAEAIQNKANGQWYCGLNNASFDNSCAYTKGCASTYRPSGAPTGNSCSNWKGPSLTDPYVDPNTGLHPPPPSGPPPGWPSGFTPGGTGGGGSTIQTGSFGPSRIPSIRNGGLFGSWGGRE